MIFGNNCNICSQKRRFGEMRDLSQLHGSTVHSGFRIIPDTQLVEYGVVDRPQDGSIGMEETNQSPEQRASPGK